MKTYTISIDGYYLTKNGDFQHTKNPKLLTLKEARERQEVYKLFGVNCKIIHTWNSIDQREWEEIK